MPLGLVLDFDENSSGNTGLRQNGLRGYDTNVMKRNGCENGIYRRNIESE